MSDLSTEPGNGYRRGGKQARQTKRSSSTTKSVGTSAIMAVLIAGLVVAGWFIANQQQQLADERSRLSATSDRLAKLEQRLQATDSAMVMEGQDTQEQLGLWESEIRKLWAVSNERNKKWIQDNEQGVARNAKTLDGIQASNRDLKAAVARHETAFEQQSSIIDQMASLELQMQQIIRGQRDLVDKVNTASQSVASMRSSLQGKVDDNSEAIEAIDAYRVAINSRLADIERRLNLVSGAPGQ